MKKNSLRIPTTAALATALAAFGLMAIGCSGADNSSAPTNTAHSTYINNGQTAADKVGAARARAHGGRLPGGGKGAQ